MKQLERDLREALARSQAPPDLAEKVFAKAEQSEKRQPFRIWMAAAALLVLMIGGINVVREQRRQSEGEQAKEQLMVGLRITGSKLRDVRERLITLQQRSVQQQSEQ